jgi:hypothetical protein
VQAPTLGLAEGKEINLSFQNKSYDGRDSNPDPLKTRSCAFAGNQRCYPCHHRRPSGIRKGAGEDICFDSRSWVGFRCQRTTSIDCQAIPSCPHCTPNLSYILTAPQRLCRQHCVQVHRVSSNNPMDESPLLGPRSPCHRSHHKRRRSTLTPPTDSTRLSLVRQSSAGSLG